MLQSISGALVAIVPIGLALVVLGIIVTVARNYRRCAPNEVLVVYGRKQKDGKGYRLITGGATFVYPILESFMRVKLDTFQVGFAVQDTPNRDGVAVSVDAVANMKISSDPMMLANAVERLLEMGNVPEKLKGLCTSTLEGQLRMIVGQLTVEEIVKDREKMQHSVLTVSKAELNKLGLEVDNFVIQKISDKHGYIDALGLARTAEVKRDAEIGRAQAEAESKIKTAQADRNARTEAATARQAAEIAEANATQAISDAQRLRDEQIAKNLAVVKSMQARVEIAAQTAAAEESKLLKVAQVAAREAEVEAETKLQEKERERMDAQMRATVIVKAEREKDARLITAEATQLAATKEGEAFRIKRAKEGEGEREYQTATAEGRKQAAAALQTEKEAEAAGQRALLLATAEGTKATGEAEGKAIAAKLLAEAEGILKKNEAMAEMSPQALRVIVLELMPQIIEKAGVAFEKALGAAMEPVGQGIAAIDSIKIVDMGNGNGNGSNPLSKIMGAAPAVLTQLFAALKATGIDPTKLFGMIGLDAKDLGAIFAVAADETVAAGRAERDTDASARGSA